MDFLTEIYLRGLSSYTALKVTGSIERAPDDVVVSTSAVHAETGGTQSIAFRVRLADDGRHAVTDLQMDGVWLALGQRAEFTAYLQQRRGDVAALADALVERAAQVRVARIETDVHRRR
jgi:ABC-type transporter MlaC component